MKLKYSFRVAPDEDGITIGHLIEEKYLWILKGMHVSRNEIIDIYVRTESDSNVFRDAITYLWTLAKRKKGDAISSERVFEICQKAFQDERGKKDEGSV